MEFVRGYEGFCRLSLTKSYDVYLQSALTNTLSNRMRNLRFKRKAKSGEGDDKEIKKRLVTPLAFSAVFKEGNFSEIKGK